MKRPEKLLLLDRDGTLVVEPPGDMQLDSFSKLKFVPGVFEALRRVRRSGRYRFVMITNQDGLGTPSFPEETFRPVHDFILETFRGEGVEFDDVLVDRSFPHENLPTRKPGTAMLAPYLAGGYDVAGSVVVGDRQTDTELAKNLGCRAVRFGGRPDPGADLATGSWEEVADYLLRAPARRGACERGTAETRVSVTVDLDGSGRAEVRTGVGFLDHMLDQVARHARIDLAVAAEGDLHVDEHHTVEDTALALGAAFREAVGEKRGMTRYGCRTVPMDEAQARVALDFSGRPYLVWKGVVPAERVGGISTTLFPHFFKSFCDTAGVTLHVAVEGEEPHHMIEAAFKGFARAVREAVRVEDADGAVPSTKGVL